MQRALPDVRDGLKPVHRRILYAMRQLRLDPDGAFKKCARVVGDVIGKFHPHGDQSIYDALVRLAQDFAARYPLVDGQGNFGNIDGDNAAAIATPKRGMTEVAAAACSRASTRTPSISAPTYDGEDEEPVVLPGAFPNLLANGSSGIAVGMATSIPPHNAAELCDAALHLIKHPERHRSRSWSSSCPGPDFPTGGIIVEAARAIVEAYETGRGGFRVRAALGEGGHGPRRLPDRRHRDSLPGAEGPADREDRRADRARRSCRCSTTSATKSAEDVRARPRAEDPHRRPGVLMESLFQLTDLESRFPLNLNVLSTRAACPA